MVAVELAYTIIASLLLMLFLSLLSLFHRNRHIAFAGNALLLAVIAVASFMLSVYPAHVLFGMLAFNAFSSAFIGLFASALILVSILALDHSGDYNLFSFLLSISLLGMFFVASAASLLEILLGLEMVTLPTVAMLLSEGKSRLESALKLFVLSVLSVTVLVFAISLIFPYSTSLMLSSLNAQPGAAMPYLVLLAIILFAASLGVETAQFPFNLWVPDVYEGAPGHITAMLAGVNKKVAFVAMMEIFLVMLLAFRGVFSPFLAVLAVFTMFFGNLLAMVQSNVKRLFAYSSISQAGYILVGIAVATSFGAEASIFQIFAHTFMIIGAFAIVSWLERSNIKSLEDYSGIGSSNPAMAISLTILMLSMAGVPPLMGFYGKFLLFSSALSANYFYLALFGIINSFMSIYYYGKVINYMFMKRGRPSLRFSVATRLVVYACVAAILVFGIYPQPIVSLASAAGSALAVL